MKSDQEFYAWRRHGAALVPSNIMAEEVLSGVKDGQEVMISVRKARNVEHHKRFFALLKITLENQDYYETTERLLDDLKVATGHYTKCYNYMNNEIYMIPKSISFAAMSQKSFEEFYDVAIRKCSELLRTDVETLAEEVWKVAGK